MNHKKQLELIYNKIDKIKQSEELFHGFRVTIGEVAKFILANIIKCMPLPSQMNKTSGAHELIKLLAGWDLSRHVSYINLGPVYSETSNPAYRNAPKWLHEMLERTYRLGDELNSCSCEDPAFISSIVPGISNQENKPSHKLFLKNLTDEIRRQSLDKYNEYEILLENPLKLQNVEYEQGLGSWVHIDLGKIHGIKHKQLVSDFGGDHASPVDISRIATELCKQIDKRIENSDVITEAHHMVQRHIASELKGCKNYKLKILQVAGVDFGSKENRHANYQTIEFEFQIKCPNHALKEISKKGSFWVKRKNTESKWQITNNNFDHIARLIKEINANGNVLRIDPVILYEIEKLDNQKKHDILNASILFSGNRISSEIHKDTAFKHIKTSYGVIGGNVEIAEGLSWSNGQLLLNRKKHDISETILLTLAGKPITAVVDYEGLPDVTIVKASATKRFIRLTTNAKPVVFEERLLKK